MLCSYLQCTRKTFMIHQTFVRWALCILFKFVKSLIRHLGLAIRNVRHVRWFSWTLYLTGVTVAQLRWHLSNMNMTFNSWYEFWFENFGNQQTGGNWLDNPQPTIFQTYHVHIVKSPPCYITWGNVLPNTHWGWCHISVRVFLFIQHLIVCS